jgi:hypothetical protein
MNLLDTIRNDVDHLLGAHAAELEHAARIEEAAASNPLVKIALDAVGLTPQMQSILADLVGKADAEATRLAAEHAAALAAVMPPGGAETPAEPAAVPEPDVDQAGPQGAAQPAVGGVA